jgi:hypothetical protein
VCESDEIAARVAQAMKDYYVANGYDALARHGKVRAEGSTGRVLDIG